MKIFSAIVLVFAFSGPLPPVAVARLCGNTVVRAKDRMRVAETIRTQGCERIYMEHLENDWYLVYGIRVLRGEVPNPDKRIDTAK